MPPENKDQKINPLQTQSLSDLAQNVETEMMTHASQASPFGDLDKKVYTPNPELKTLRTFQGDMEERIHNKKESIVSIAAAEQNVQKKVAPVILKEENSNFFLTHSILPIAGLILVFVGALSIATIYYFNAVNNAPVAVTPQTTLISSAKKEIVEVGADPKQDITQHLVNSKKSFTGTVGSILYIQFVKEKSEIPETEFFKYIAPSAPSALMRSFDAQYMSGVYALDTNEIFFILSTVDFGQTFSGMLKWEGVMQNDLSPYFPNITDQTKNTSVFQDDTFNNRDVRVVRNTNGKIILLYGFVDKNTVIITANEKIFQSIASKYINSKQIR